MKMKKVTVFEGVCTALITPFINDTVDFDSLEKLIERQIEAGIPAVAVCATTGESATLTNEEHRSVIRFACECAGGRIKIIAGTGSNDTRHSVKMSMYACEAGADALLVVSPYYNKATQTGLIKSYRAIADASAVPVIMYNVPTRTCVDISPETYAALCRHPKICAVKEASSHVSKISEIKNLCGDGLDIYSGNDDLTLPLLSLGAKGAVSVISNLLPEKMNEICSAFFENDIVRAREIHLSLAPLMRALFCEVNPIPVKYAASRMGLCRADVRLPLCEISDTGRAKIDAELEKLGLI